MTEEALFGDVQRLLMEQAPMAQAEVASCTISGFGTYGTPQYIETEKTVPISIGAYGYGELSAGSYGLSSLESLSTSDLAEPRLDYGDRQLAGYGGEEELSGYGYGASAQQLVRVKTLVACTPLVTRGRLLGVGGLTNCRVSKGTIIQQPIIHRWS
jgi:hypothetical protein